jgi:hypothetical protein
VLATNIAAVTLRRGRDSLAPRIATEETEPRR